MSNTSMYCIHRQVGAVLCDTVGACLKCGWFPDVEEKRKAKIRERLKENNAEKCPCMSYSVSGKV